MSFLFVDRILRMDEGRFIQGIKQVTLSDAYLCPSWNDKTANAWVLMSSIIGETLGQLGAWCAMHANGFTLRPVAGVVSAVHIHDEVNVGETLFLETTIDALDEAAVEYHSLATVNGRTIFTIESALGPMLPMEDFIDPLEVKAQFAKIYRIGENPPHPNFPPCGGKLGWGVTPTHIAFDTILECQPGKQMTAQKSFSLSAPYVPDHFPRKPVLPLTILLEAKLQLSASFLAASFEDGKDFRPVTVRKIKMSGFVQPGDSVMTTIRLKEKTEEQIIISYHTEMYGKRVCMAEAVFKKTQRGADE